MTSNGADVDSDYYFQMQYLTCSHTISNFGRYNEHTDADHAAGKLPMIMYGGSCEDCNALQRLNGNSLTTAHITKLHSDINVFSKFMDNTGHNYRQDPAILAGQQAKIESLRQRVNQQAAELGQLGKQIKDSPAKKLPALQNNSQQPTAEMKKLQKIATIGFTNPITTGFSTLKSSLEEHRWDPFIRSLFTELQEVVRRNSYEEIYEIHDRMQSFAEAFDNNLSEKVERVEGEIVGQCEEGVRRLLGMMF